MFLLIFKELFTFQKLHGPGLKHETKIIIVEIYTEVGNNVIVYNNSV